MVLLKTIVFSTIFNFVCRLYQAFIFEKNFSNISLSTNKKKVFLFLKTLSLLDEPVALILIRQEVLLLQCKERRLYSDEFAYRRVSFEVCDLKMWVLED